MDYNNEIIITFLFCKKLICFYILFYQTFRCSKTSSLSVIFSFSALLKSVTRYLGYIIFLNKRCSIFIDYFNCLGKFWFTSVIEIIILLFIAIYKHFFFSYGTYNYKAIYFINVIKRTSKFHGIYETTWNLCTQFSTIIWTIYISTNSYYS